MRDGHTISTKGALDRGAQKFSTAIKLWHHLFFVRLGSSLKERVVKKRRILTPLSRPIISCN